MHRVIALSRAAQKPNAKQCVAVVAVVVVAVVSNVQRKLQCRLVHKGTMSAHVIVKTRHPPPFNLVCRLLACRTILRGGNKTQKRVVSRRGAVRGGLTACDALQASSCSLTTSRQTL